MALAGVRGEQLQHGRVVGGAVAGQGVADDAREVEVAGGDGVRGAVGALDDLGGGPGADARDRLQERRRLLGGRPAARSRREWRRTARRIVAARLSSTPARCHSQDGIRDQARGSGMTAIRSGAGPGAGSPCRVSRRRQARYASSAVTFCSSTEGIRDSSTRPVLVSLRPVARRAESATRRWRGVNASGLSAAPSSSGSRSRNQSAPGPQAVASALPARRVTRSVAGPSGCGWRARRHGPGSGGTPGRPGRDAGRPGSGRGRPGRAGSTPWTWPEPPAWPRRRPAWPRGTSGPPWDPDARPGRGCPRSCRTGHGA